MRLSLRQRQECRRKLPSHGEVGEQSPRRLRRRIRSPTEERGQSPSQAREYRAASGFGSYLPDVGIGIAIDCGGETTSRAGGNVGRPSSRRGCECMHPSSGEQRGDEED